MFDAITDRLLHPRTAEREQEEEQRARDWIPTSGNPKLKGETHHGQMVGAEASQTQLALHVHHQPKLARLAKQLSSARMSAAALVPPAMAAAATAIASARNHLDLEERLRKTRPRLLTGSSYSPRTLHLITVLVVFAAWVLTSGAFAALGPAQSDALTQLLASAHIDISWLLGAAQVTGVMICGLIIGWALGWAMAPQRQRRRVRGSLDDEPSIVIEERPRAMYIAIAVFMSVVAGGCVYAIAWLRGYSISLSAALAASAPTGSGAGSLGAGAAPPSPHAWIIMFLAALELVVTVGACLKYDAPLARAAAKLAATFHHSTGELHDALQRLGEKLAAVDAARIELATARRELMLRTLAPTIEAMRLETIHRAAHTDSYGAPGQQEDTATRDLNAILEKSTDEGRDEETPNWPKSYPKPLQELLDEFAKLHTASAALQTLDQSNTQTADSDDEASSEADSDETTELVHPPADDDAAKLFAVPVASANGTGPSQQG
jgi:hypothetical protein